MPARRRAARSARRRPGRRPGRRAARPGRRARRPGRWRPPRPARPASAARAARATPRGGCRRGPAPGGTRARWRSAPRCPAPGGWAVRRGARATASRSARAIRGGTASWTTSASAPGVAVGDLAAQPQQRRGEHRLGGQHLGERGERAAVVAVGAPLDDEAVVELAALPAALDHPGPEAHPDPYPGPGLLVHGGGHRVVEELVEVEQPLVDQDAGHRQALGQRGAAPGAGLGPRLPGPCARSPGSARAARRPAAGARRCPFSPLTL